MPREQLLLLTCRKVFYLKTGLKRHLQPSSHKSREKDLTDDLCIHANPDPTEVKVCHTSIPEADQKADCVVWTQAETAAFLSVHLSSDSDSESDMEIGRSNSDGEPEEAAKPEGTPSGHYVLDLGLNLDADFEEKEDVKADEEKKLKGVKVAKKDLKADEKKVKEVKPRRRM